MFKSRLDVEILLCLHATIFDTAFSLQVIFEVLAGLRVWPARPCCFRAVTPFPSVSVALVKRLFVTSIGDSGVIYTRKQGLHDDIRFCTNR